MHPWSYKRRVVLLKFWSFQLSPGSKWPILAFELLFRIASDSSGFENGGASPRGSGNDVYGFLCYDQCRLCFTNTTLYNPCNLTMHTHAIYKQFHVWNWMNIRVGCTNELSGACLWYILRENRKPLGHLFFRHIGWLITSLNSL